MGITIKGFISKASGRVSAVAFLAAHREFLTTGELASVTSPILVKLDKGEIMATPALQELCRVMLDYHLNAEITKGSSAATKPAKEPTSKAYLVTVYDGKDQVCTRFKEVRDPDTGAIEEVEEDLIHGADSLQAAEGWADRRLFDGAPDWYAVVASTKGSMRFVVRRDESIARILKRPHFAVHKVNKGDGRLGNKMRVKGDKVTFSGG